MSSVMECPACRRALQERTVDGVTVDVCDGGCGGLWFDKGELDHFDEPHESAGSQLLAVKRDPACEVDRDARYDCHHLAAALHTLADPTLAKEVTARKALVELCQPPEGQPFGSMSAERSG